MAPRKRSKRMTACSRQLRRQLTRPEQVLWDALRNRQLAGLKFRRQHPIGKYVVDFFCHERLLIIEVDGDSHDGRYQQDRCRQNELESRGYRVLRLANDDVLEDLEHVLEAILLAAGEKIP